MKGKMQRVIHLFREIDSSGDGKVDLIELEETFDRLGLEASQEEVEQVYVLLDKDGDGSVDYRELINTLQDTQDDAEATRKAGPRVITVGFRNGDKRAEEKRRKKKEKRVLATCESERIARIRKQHGFRREIPGGTDKPAPGSTPHSLRGLSKKGKSALFINVPWGTTYFDDGDFGSDDDQDDDER